jgi:PadR family transcriptional regulator, regulatory protein PadR
VFQHGTLYPVLHRLEREGYIAGRWSRGDGRRKKLYRLTRAGRKRLEGEARRVTDVLSALATLLAGPDHAPA